MATHSSILAWRIPWTEIPGGLQSRGHKESDTTAQLHFHSHPVVCNNFPRMLWQVWNESVTCSVVSDSLGPHASVHRILQNRAPQYVRQILTSMKEEINSNTVIVGNFNTPLTTMDRSTKQKINKETQTLKDTMDQIDLIDIYRAFHPKTINFTFFSVHTEPSTE